MKCPKCNNENLNDAKFCTECGTALFKKCDKCGGITNLYSKFCPECGSQYPILDIRVEYYKRRMDFYDEIVIGECKDGKYILVKDRLTYKILDVDNLKSTTPYEFESVGRFAELDSFNFIIVKKDGLWGLINPVSGHIICDFKYEDYVLVYYEGSYVTNGTVLLKERSKWGKVEGNTGQVILPFIYDEIYESALDDYHIDFDLLKYNGFWGVVAQGNQLIPFEYIKLGYRGIDRCEYLYDYVTYDKSIPPSQHKNSKWGIINIYSGETLLDPRYDEIKPFGEDTYQVRKGSKWGVVKNHDGKIVLPCEYDLIDKFSKSDDYKVRQENKWGVVSPYGKVLLECKFNEIIEWGDGFERNVYKLLKDHEWGLYSDGEIVLACEYDEIIDYGICYIMRKGEKWGISTNIRILSACEYDEIEKCTGKGTYYKVRKGPKFGVVSDCGEVLSCEYDEILFKDYSADITMRKGDKWGKIIFRTYGVNRYDCLYSLEQVEKMR